MPDVLVIQSQHSCHVFCECGYVGSSSGFPELCPACGGEWRNPKLEAHAYAEERST